MKSSDFYTREGHNRPTRVKLIGRDGKESSEWLDVVGSDSDRMADWLDNQRERFRELAEAQKDARPAILRRHKMEEAAVCVVGWSLEDECTTDAVAKLLGESRRNFMTVEVTVFKDSFFFAGNPPPSSNGQSNTSEASKPAESAEGQSPSS